MNERDSETIAALLRREGYAEVKEPLDADIVVLNTCAVRESAEAKVWSRFGRLASQRKGNEPLFVLAGCMAELAETEKRVRARAPYVKVLVGPANLHNLPALLERGREGLASSVSRPRATARRDETTQMLPEGLPRGVAPGVFAYVTVMYGCDNFCSYCIVPYVRGPQVSRRPGDVLSEIRSLSDLGCKEVTLLGQNVNAFGLDFREGEETMDFADLLLEVDKVPGLERIRYYTSHPRDFTDKMIWAVRDGTKICEHFHLPLQSGSNRILTLMNRGYTKERYLELISQVRDLVPRASFTTDVIVGFPGETEADFLETLDVVTKARFDGAFTFMYSPRGGTGAASMKDQIPKKEKSARLQELVRVQSEMTLENNRALVGTVERILVDETSSGPDTVKGRTRTNKTILAECRSPVSAGDMLRVKILEAGVWHLKGVAV